MKINSASYSINDILIRTHNMIPPPLIAGYNISIKDNIVSCKTYDDTDVRKLIMKNKEETKQ